MKRQFKTTEIERRMTQGTVNVLYNQVPYTFEKENGVRKIKAVKQVQIKVGKGPTIPKFDEVRQLVPGNFKHPNWKR